MNIRAVNYLIAGEVAVVSGTLLFLLTYGLWPFDGIDTNLCAKAWFFLATILAESVLLSLFFLYDETSDAKEKGGAK